MRFFLISLLAIAGGCTRYEYNITQPSDLVRHIGKESDEILKRDPLEYRLITVDSRLVMRIYNQSEGPISLLGDRSFVVDAAGQSHPFASQTLAPQSFIKLILPPLRPTLERTGPSIGIGVGGVIGSARNPYRPGYDPLLDDQPMYFRVYDNDAIYWDWDGETEVHLTLVFQRDQQTFSHDFVIRRQKM